MCSLQSIPRLREPRDKGKPGSIGRSKPGKTRVRRRRHHIRRRSRARVLPNTLSMAGNSGSKERSVPEQDVIPTSCQRCAGEPGITSPPPCWCFPRIQHRSQAMGPMETQQGYNKEELNEPRPAPKPHEGHWYPLVFSPMGPTRVPCQRGRSGRCWERAGSARDVPVQQEQQLRVTPKAAFPIPGWVFEAEGTHSVLSRPQECEGMCLVANREWGDPEAPSQVRSRTHRSSPYKGGLGGMGAGRDIPSPFQCHSWVILSHVIACCALLCPTSRDLVGPKWHLMAPPPQRHSPGTAL